VQRAARATNRKSVPRKPMIFPPDDGGDVFDLFLDAGDDDFLTGSASASVSDPWIVCA